MFPGESREDFDCLFPLLEPMVGTRSGCVSSVLESSVGAEDEENFLYVCCTKTSACICAWDGVGCHDVGKSGRVCSVIDPLLAAVPGSMEFVGDIIADDDPNATAD